MIRILVFVLLFLSNNIFGFEISAFCPGGGNCTIKGTLNDEIKINTTYNSIINYATFTNNSTSFILNKNNSLSNFINYGNMNTFWTESSSTGTTNIYNYGILNNTSSNANFALSGANVKIYYFNMKIDENSNAFNSITGNLSSKPHNERNSHILINTGSSGELSLDNNAKIVLNFGDSFEIDKAYDMTKLILKCDNSNNIDACSNPYDKTKDQVITKISTYNDKLYKLNINGNNLSVSLDTSYASANAIYKANLLSINTIKNQLNQILQNKKTIENTQKHSRFRARRIQANEINIESDSTTNESNSTTNANDENYFLFSPFISYQNIFDGGKYSGLGYGFISGYNADLNDDNLLGLHFGFMGGGGKVILHLISKIHIMQDS